MATRLADPPNWDQFEPPIGPVLDNCHECGAKGPYPDGICPFCENKFRMTKPIEVGPASAGTTKKAAVKQGKCPCCGAIYDADQVGALRDCYECNKQMKVVTA